MKRFFRNLKTLAMAAVVGLATLTVSCYDDTELREGIKENQESIADLTARVEALEIKLGNEVNALKALIADEIAKVNDAIEAVEDKIVIAGAEQNANGEWVLTLVDGKTVTVYPEFHENNEGLLTVIEEGGVYFWAKIVNGVATKITDANGNGYIVHHPTIVPEIEIPESHAEPQVRVNEAGFTEVSFDGGQTWHQLGGGDTGLFESVIVEGDTLTFTMNGGEVFTVTLPEEFAFEVEGNKVFFAAEQSVEVRLKSTGIKDLTVIAKPEGWKAVIDGQKLVVTAPAAEAAGAEIEGAVKVLAVTNEGKAAVGRILVSAGKGYTISLGIREAYVGMDENYENIYEETMCVIIDNQMTQSVEDLDGTVYEQPVPLTVGIFPKGEFTLEELADQLAEGWYGDYPYETFNVYENGESAFALKTLWVDMFSGQTLEYEPGAAYTIFATKYTSAGWNYVYDVNDIVLYEYVNRSINVEEVSTSFNDVQIKVDVKGYDNYRFYFSQAQYNWEDEWENAAAWNEPFGNPGTLTSFEGSLFDFGYYDDGYSSKELGLPNTLYTLVIVPEVDGQYLKENAIVKNFKTANVTAGGTISPVFTEGKIDYSSIRVNVDAKDAAFVYYNWYNEDVINEMTPEELFEGITLDGVPRNITSFELSRTGMAQGQSIYLAAYAIDSTGKYGQVVTQKFTTKMVEFHETMAITIDEFKVSNMGNEAWVKFSVTGATAEIAQYRYANVNNSYSWNSSYGGDFESAARYMATVPNEYYGPKFVDPATGLDENGYLHLTGLYPDSDPYNFVIIAIDVNGAISKGAGMNYTPEFDVPFIYAEDAEYGLQPTVVIGEITEGSYDWTEDDYTGSYTITPAAGTVCYAHLWDEEYEGTYNTPYKLMQYLVTNALTNTSNSSYYPRTVTEETTVTFEDKYIYATSYIYVAWKDEAGNYYQPIKVKVLPAVETPEVPVE